MSDYSPEDLAMSSAIEGFQPMKYSFLGNRAESDDYDRTYGVKQGAIRRKLKKKIMAQNIMGTKAGQWSARKSQELKRQYEESCEKKGLKPYKGKKTEKQKDLSKWSKQDWTTKSGKPSSQTGERYLPKKAIKALTDEEYKKTSAKKRKDTKKGKQFSDQPKSIAKKVKKYRAESSKPHSVTISRSSNPEKKLMAVFEDSEGNKMKTTHFGQRGASDYTKHGDKERMERYLERHGGGFETSTKEDWKDPTTAGSLSRWILWNKPGLKSSFDDYKRRFGLKGEISVSKSAEGKVQDNSHAVAVLVPDPKQKVEGVVRFTQDGNTLHVDYEIENLFPDGEHGFHVHEYGDLTDGCESACAHFNPDGETHGGLDSATRHLGDLGNIISKNGISKGRISTDTLSLNMGARNCIIGRMIIVHQDRDDLGKGGDAESLKTGNAGKRLACGVIGLSEGKDFDAEGWDDIPEWQPHTPTIDPSPFEEIEWKTLTPPPHEVRTLMKKMEKAGYTVLVVGGAVRDLMLGLEPKDYDLATDATPEEIEKVVGELARYKYVKGAQGEMAKRALTSLVLAPTGEVIEITTFRAELGYEDGNRAKPIAIPAESFEEDASRRDLTINAMGMDKDGLLKDPMGGKEDLEDGVIRAVGNPNERFQEDPLRMIRAIRFSVRFGLPIEPETYQAITDNVELVSTLSSRRLRDEIGKVLVQPNGFRMLMETGVLPTLMPEMRDMEQYEHNLDYHPEGNLYNHYIVAFDTFTQIPNRTEMGAWALLFHDIAKPMTADWVEESQYHTFYGHDKKGAQLIRDNYNNETGPFEFSKKELEALAWTTEHHLGKFWEMKKETKVADMGNSPHFPLLLQVIEGDMMKLRRHEDDFRERIEFITTTAQKINERKAKTGNRPPGFAIRVFEELDVPKGKERGIIMNQIEEMISTGQVSSYDEALEVLKTKRNA